MTWRFRKSFKLLPGIRLSLTPRGISTTIGVAPLSVNIGPRGLFANTAIPGTGVWSRTRLDGGPSTSGSRSPVPPKLQVPLTPAPTVEDRNSVATEFRSASTEEITSEGLAEFRALLSKAQREQEELRGELERATLESKAKEECYRSWADGILMKRIRPRRFAELKAQAEEAVALLDELKEQLRLTTLATEIDLPEAYAAAFHRLCDAFAAMAESAKIWDMLSSRATNKVAERTAVDASVTREPVRFSLGGTDLVQTKWRVPHLENRNGGDLYLYPGFLLYRVSREAFAVIDAQEITISYAAVNFHEEELVPPDSEVVGHSWIKVNKDGSPDRRFKGNQQIPVARYGKLEFSSNSGLNEQYLVSNSEKTREFVAAWDHCRVSFQRQ